MDWNSWIGKKVKLVLKDGYTKYGTLVSAETPFIEIEFRDGKRELLNMADITAIKEGV